MNQPPQPPYPSLSNPPAPFPSLSEQVDANFARTLKRYQTYFPNPPQPPLHPASHFFVTASADTTQCPLCALTFPSHNDLLTHIGMAHPNAYCHTGIPTTKDRSLYCAVCEVQCETIQQLTAHEQGQKHRKKNEIHKAFVEKSRTFAREGVQQMGVGIWMCTVCGVSVEGKNEIMQHLDATKHKRNREMNGGVRRPKSKKRGRGDGRNAVQQMPNPFGGMNIRMGPNLQGMSSQDIHGLEQGMQGVSTVQNVPAPQVPLQGLPQSVSNVSGGIPGVATAAAGMSAAQSGSQGGAPGLMSALSPSNVTSEVPAPSMFTSAPFSIWSTPVIGKTSTGGGGFGGVEGARLAVGGEGMQGMGGGNGGGKMPGAEVVKVGEDESRRTNVRVGKKQLPTEKKGKEFGCSTCGVICNSMDSLNVHLASAKHRKKMIQESTTEGALYCKVCNVTCCGKDNFEAHLKGKPHAKKLRLNGQAQDEE